MSFDVNDLRLFVRIEEKGRIKNGEEMVKMELGEERERVRGMEELEGVEMINRERMGV